MPDNPTWFYRRNDGRLCVSSALRDRMIGLAAVYILFAMVFDAPLWRPGHVLAPNQNVQVTEAQAWLDGTLALPERRGDTALYEGRVYSFFPPVMTFLSVAILPWSPEGVPFNVLATLFVLPIPGLAFLLFLRRSETVVAAVVMTCAFVLGTSELAVLRRTMQSGKVWHLNHAITQLGLLLFLLDYFGRRRIWLGGLGVLVACWARFTLAVYLLPFCWAAITSKRTSHRVMGAATAVLAVGVPMTLNALKYDDPLRPGYRLVDEGRDHAPPRELEVGFFSVRHVPRNLYAMGVGPPRCKETSRGRRLVPNTDATGIWWTTPLLLYLFLDGRRIWRSAKSQPLLLSVVFVFAALMMYYWTGATQRGYNRYSLDFMLPLLVMMTPFAMKGRRRYITPAMVAWSAYYFGWWIT